MKKVLGLAAACLVAGVALAAEEIKSGLPVGEEVPPFNVRDITGPAKGTTLCYRCKYGDQPVVAVFARDLSENVKDLVKKVDGVVGKNADKKMAAFVVVMTDDPDAFEPKLEALAKDAKLAKTPLTIVEGAGGPPDYKISKDADVTVMMWVNSEVKVNQAFAKGKLDKKSVDKLIDDTKKILD